MGRTVLDCSSPGDKAILVGYSSDYACGVLRITGGTLRTLGNGTANPAVTLGGGSSASYAGRADLVIDGGILDASGNEVGVLWRGAGAATSTLTITNNGSMTNDTVSFAGFNATAYGTGTVNLSGGTLTTKRITALHSAPNSTVNFNGTRLVVGGAEIGGPLLDSTIANVRVLSGGAIIDTAGVDSRITARLVSGATSDGGLTKLGLGTLTLSNTASFNGPISVQQGALVMKLPVPSTSAAVSSNASLSLSGAASKWTLGNLALTNATLSLDYGSFNGDTTAALNVTNLSLSGTVKINVAGSSFPLGDITLLTYSSKSGTGAFTAGTLPPLPPGASAASLLDTGSSVVLHFTSDIQNLVWSGGSDDTWQVNGGADWNNNGATYQEYPSGVGDVVTFDESYGGGLVFISGAVKPTFISVNTTNSGTVYIFGGSGSISGPTALTKSGSGILQINTANDFSGTVTVSGGFLKLNNPAALGATNGGTVVSSGGTLELGVMSGTGLSVVGETVTINGAGTVGSIGALCGNSSTSDNIWAGPVILGGSTARMGTEANGNLTISGNITDNGTNFIAAFAPGFDGVVTVSGTNNNYGGDTALYGNYNGVDPSTVRLGADNAFPAKGRLVLGNCICDLNGHNQTSAGLAKSTVSGMNSDWCVVRNDGGGMPMLTLNPASSQTYPGFITGSLGICKLGTNTQTFSRGGLDYTGPTIVNGGTLAVALPLSSSSALTVANGAALSVTVSNVPWSPPTMTLTNATLSFNYGTLSGAPGIAFMNTALNVSGSNVVNITGAGIPEGSMTLIGYATQSGTGQFYVGAVPTGMQASITNTGSAIVLNVTYPAAQALTWSGANTQTWNTNGTPDWNGGPGFYREYTNGLADSVTFDDTATAFTVGIANDVRPSSIVVNNKSNSYTFSGSGRISGSTGLTKSGTNTLQINNANAFTGATTVSAGTLIINNPTALGSADGGVVVNSNATLTVGALSGSGVTVSGETVTVNGPGTDGIYGALRGNICSAGDNVWNGPVIIGSSTARIGAGSNGTLTVSGTITDGGTNYVGFFRAGPGGVVTLSGTNNSWGGDTMLYGSSTDTTVGRIRLGADNAFPAGSRLVLGNCTLDLNGHNQVSAGLSFNWATGVSNVWTVVTSSGSEVGMLTLNPYSNQSFPGTVTGNLGITKQGTSTQTLSSGGLLTYTGPTVVNAGTLAVTLPMSSSALTVADGAALSVTVSNSSWAPSVINLTNATLSLNYGALSGTPGAVFTANALNVSGSNVVNITGSGIPASPLTLIAYSGKSGAGQFYLGSVPAGVQASINDTGSAIVLNVIGSSQTLTWSGTTSGTWNTNSTLDWNNGASFYKESPGALGDMVTFDDSGTNLVSVANDVRPYSMLVNNSAKAYTFSGPGKISGPTGLTKRGTNVLTLTAANGYSGGTVLSAGTISFASGALGSTSNIVLSAATTLQWGPGNTQDLSGRLRIDGGYGDAAHLASLDTGTNNVVFTTGLSQTSTGGPITNTVGKSGSGTLTLAGGISTLGQVTRINNGTLEIATGATLNLDGAGNLTNAALVIDYSTLLVSGGTANIGDRLAVATIGYSTGTVTIASGTVNVEIGSTLSTRGLRLAGGTSPTTNNLATVNLDGGLLTVPRIFPGTGSSNISIVNFNGGILKPSTNVYAATFMTNLTHAYVKAGGAIFDSDGTNVTLGQALEHDSGVAVDGGLTTRGSGTLVLAGNNTYNGLTVVSNHSTLLIQGALGTNQVTVCAGATLGGTGVINGSASVAAGGTLSPGATTNLGEVLTIGNNLSLAGTTLIAIGKPGLTLQADGVTVSNVTYGGALVLTNVTGATLALGDAVTLFAASGSSTGNFSSITPAPGDGLAWSFNPTNGTLSVVSASAPVPVAIPDMASTPWNVPVTVSPLANDSDPSGFTLSLLSISNATNGLASISGNNVVITPTRGSTAPVTVGYSITNGNGGTASSLITVTVTMPPKASVNSVTRSGANLVLSGTNGAANGTYYVLTSTNVALGLTNWLPILTNTFDGSGYFSVTNTINPATPKSFFLIEQ